MICSSSGDTRPSELDSCCKGCTWYNNFQLYHLTIFIIIVICYVGCNIELSIVHRVSDAMHTSTVCKQQLIAFWT